MFLSGRPASQRIASSDSKTQSLSLAQKVISEIAPLFPIKHFVAVNPWLSLHGTPMTEVGKTFAAINGARVFPNASLFEQYLEKGDIKNQQQDERRRQITSLLAEMQELEHSLGLHVNPKVDSLCSMISETAAKWFGSLVNDSSAVWQLKTSSENFFEAWHNLASTDYSLDLLGYSALRKEIKAMPAVAADSFVGLFEALDGDSPKFQQLLQTLMYQNFGWLSYCRYLDRSLTSDNPYRTYSFQALAILSAYALACLRSGFDSILQPNPAMTSNTDRDLSRYIHIASELQNIFEIQQRQPLLAQLKSNAKQSETSPSPWQAIFCIDVRSEPLRRNLESLSSNFKTIGFAGFFGLPIAAHNEWGEETARCPVILQPGFKPRSEAAKRTSALLAESASKSSKNLATCFSFVEVFGLTFAPRLARQLLKTLGFEPKPEQQQEELASHTPKQYSLSLTEKVNFAQSFLQGTGLKGRMGRLVLICGHGASSQNNPHASGLDCGACGGHKGDVNAVLAASILNQPELRQQLAGSEFEIPEQTFFVAGFHNTTTNRVDLLGKEQVPATFRTDISEIEVILKEARALTNLERNQSDPAKVTDHKASAETLCRATSIGEIRPEWGLARNAFFIAAPRQRSKGLNLAARSFLHDYHYNDDRAGTTLSQIMQGPLMVAIWINLQYYASSVDPEVFGAGTKVLHSAVGTAGVVEGTSWKLQTGLPWQSVHDGESLVHQPVRLQAILEAPVVTIEAILKKQPELNNLIRNQWFKLFACEPGTGNLFQCEEAGKWTAVDAD